MQSTITEKMDWLRIPFPLRLRIQAIQEEPKIEEFFGVESRCVISGAYLINERFADLRSDAIKLINKVIRRGDDELARYFALAFFDRFASSFTQEEIPDLQTRVDLIAISCLSLAWGLKDKPYSRQNLVDRCGLTTKKSTLLITESEILDVLDSQMLEVTALSFAKYLISQIPLDLSYKQYIDYRNTVEKIIIEAPREDIKFTRFKPSVIAASAILATIPSGLRDMCREQLLNCRKKILNEEEVDECLAEMTAMFLNKNILHVQATNENEGVSSVPSLFQQEAACQNHGDESGISTQKVIINENEGLSSVPSLQQEQVAHQNDGNEAGTSSQKGITNENEGVFSVPPRFSLFQQEDFAAQDADNEEDGRPQQRSKKCHNTCTLP